MKQQFKLKFLFKTVFMLNFKYKQEQSNNHISINQLHNYQLIPILFQIIQLSTNTQSQTYSSINTLVLTCKNKQQKLHYF